MEIKFINLNDKYCAGDKHGTEIIKIPNHKTLCNTCFAFYGQDRTTYPEWLFEATRLIHNEYQQDRRYSKRNIIYQDDNSYDDLKMGHKHTNQPRPKGSYDD